MARRLRGHSGADAQRRLRWLIRYGKLTGKLTEMLGQRANYHNGNQPEALFM